MDKSVSNQCFKDDIKTLLYKFGVEVNLYASTFHYFL